MSDDLASLLSGGEHNMGDFGGGAPKRSIAPLPNVSDDELIARAAVAEGDPNNPESWRNVAGVIRNRAKKSGKSVADVLSEPGQFEAFSNGHIQGVDTNSAAYKAASEAIAPVLNGQIVIPPDRDMFFNPAIVAQRGVKPPFDPATGTTIGTQLFGSGYRPDASGDDLAALLGDNVNAASVSAPQAPGASPAQTPAEPPANPKAGWPKIYDPQHNVTRYPDGSLAGIGNITKPATRAADGALEVDISGSSEPEAIANWLKAHPNDIANKPETVAPVPAATNWAQKLDVGGQRGIQDVTDTLQKPFNYARDLVASGLDLNDPTAGARHGGMNALMADQFQRQYGNSPLVQGGRIAGNIAATAPLMMAADVPMAGLGALTARAAPAAAPLTDFLAGTAGTGMAQLPSIAARNALMGGEGAALTSAGNPNESFGQQVLQGTEAGGLLGPVAHYGAQGVGAGLNALVGTGSALRAAVQPFTQRGRDEIADSVIRRFSDGGPVGIDATEYIPGSRPTLAQATGNGGLGALEKGGRATGMKNLFAERDEQNNAARRDVLERVTGNDNTLQDLVAERTATVAPLRDAALANADAAAPHPIINAIDQALASPAGQSDVVTSTLNKARGKIVQPPPEMSPTDLADFNRQVSTILGAPEASPVLDQATMSSAKAATGRIYDDVLSRAQVPLDDEALHAFAAVGSQARELGLDPNQIAALDAQIAKITDLAIRNGGVIPGDAFKTMTESASTLSRLQQGGGTLGHLAGDLDDALKSALARSAAPEDVALVNRANAQWKAMRTIEPQVLAAERASPGAPQITPNQALGAVTRNYKTYAYNGGGDLGDLASGAVRAQGNRGPTLQTSPAQLHAIRTDLDGKIQALASKGDEASKDALNALLRVRSAMDDTLETAAPGYKRYVAANEEAAHPINEQTYLQGTKFGDTHDNPTLAKVNSALDRIYALRNKPGDNLAKSISPETITHLENLRADLKREASAAYAGRVPGSDTFQNLATNNLMSSVGVPLSAGLMMVGHHPVLGTLAGLGRLAYSSQNNRILEGVANRLVDPELGARAFAPITAKDRGAVAKLFQMGLSRTAAPAGAITYNRLTAPAQP